MLARFFPISFDLGFLNGAFGVSISSNPPAPSISNGLGRAKVFFFGVLYSKCILLAISACNSKTQHFQNQNNQSNLKQKFRTTKSNLKQKWTTVLNITPELTASLTVFETRTSCSKSSWSTPHNTLIYNWLKKKQKYINFRILITKLGQVKKIKLEIGILTRTSRGRASRRDLSESKVNFPLHILFNGFTAELELREEASLCNNTTLFLPSVVV